jgi:hypothetical protein
VRFCLFSCKPVSDFSVLGVMRLGSGQEQTFEKEKKEKAF